MQFTFLEVKKPALLNKVYEFRCRILCDELKVFNHADYPDGKETDDYDRYSEHFAALNENGEVCGCVRLIHHSPIGYPTENFMTLDIDTGVFERERLAELSRIFIGPEYRSLKTTKKIMEGLKKIGYLKMKEHGIAYSYGALEKGFLRLLRMYKMDYVSIGKVHEYGGESRYPSVLYTEKLEQDNPILIELWKEKHDTKDV